jgi:ATP synthase protein I
MHSSDARVLRGAAIPSGLAGIAAIAVGLLLAGSKGALGAAIGAVVVIAFFSISVIAVSYASKISPQLMFAAAVFSYMTKVLAMFALIVALEGVSAWDSRAFAWSVIALTLVWIGAEIRATLRAKTFYADPEPSVAPAADRSP